ncbi:MAG: response regulator [Planctomycetes bacterium]|nr:response regulator [Planctomycetota bacterium]
MARMALLVVDDSDLCRAYWETLEREGYRVLSASGSGEALRTLRVHLPDVVVVILDEAGLVSRLHQEVGPHRIPIVEVTPRTGVSRRESLLTRPWRNAVRQLVEEAVRDAS